MYKVVFLKGICGPDHVEADPKNAKEEYHKWYQQCQYHLVAIYG
jgi:hypothetical protein